jgi:hypothetical protein
MTCMTAKRLSLMAAAALALGSVSAPATAQVRAILPTIDQVVPLDPLPIDGVWEIREINERIVIENGHAYAEDGWVHLMLFEIEPEQVVIKNIRELADGDFVAQDLPLMASIKMSWLGRDTLRARTDGLIPATYHLERVSGGGSDWRDRDDERRDDFDDDDFGGPPPEDDDAVSPW